MQYVSVVIPERHSPLSEVVSSFAHKDLCVQSILVCKRPETVLAFGSATTSLDQQQFEITPAYYHEPLGAAALYFGRLAKYRRVLIWCLDVPMHPIDLENALALFDGNKAIGYAGFCADKTRSLTGARWLDQVESATEVDYLSTGFLLVDRRVLENPVFARLRRSESSPDFEIGAALKRDGLSLTVIPHVGHYPLRQPAWTREDFFRFAYSVLNKGFAPKKWHEINMKMLPSLAKGEHFARLKELNRPPVLVFGCQRSGTSWLNQLLGEAISSVVSLSENRTFDFLLDGLDLPDDFKDSTLSLQTTFIVSERESYLNVPRRTLRVFVLRNPLSVCWSLLYHFNALEMVWSARRLRFSSGLLVQFDGKVSDLDKSICLYLDSVATAELLLQEAGAETVLIDYDQLVLRPKEAVEAVIDRMRVLQPEMTCSSNAVSDYSDVVSDLKPLRKHEQLSEFESERIRAFCCEKYMTLRKRASNVHHH